MSIKSLISLIAICGVLRAITSIVAPENGMKNITNISCNIIIFGSIFSSIILYISKIFT